MDLDVALNNLEDAVEFFDKVKAATPAEKTAAGTDHWDWLEQASRDVVTANREARLDAAITEFYHDRARSGLGACNGKTR